MTENMEWEEASVEHGYVDLLTQGTSITGQHVMDIISMEIDIDPLVLQGSKRQIVVVPDTNVFIHSLGLIREILRDTKETADWLLVLSWMVLQELDRLRRKNTDAQAAINYINDLLVQKHPRLKPQRPSHVAEAAEEFEGGNADDSILQCAMRYCGKLSEGQIVFVTNDKNLRSKALVVALPNLIVCDAFSALDKLLALTNKTGHRGSRRSSNSRSKSKRKLVVRQHPGGESSTNQNSSRKRNVSPVASVSLSIPLFTPMRKKKPQKALEPDGSYKSFGDIRNLLCDTISFIIEFQMKEDFGANWLKCLKIPPPWTVETGLRCILSHWIAVFSFVFGKTMKTTEKLLEKVRSHKKFFSSSKHCKEGPSRAFQEEILEIFVELLNAADDLKAMVVSETQFGKCKKILLTYLWNLRDDQHS